MAITAAQIQAFAGRVTEQLETQFPGTVTISSQSYACSVSGWRGRDLLAEGGAEASRTITVQLPRSRFVDAEKPVPRGLTPITVTAPLNIAGTYTIDDVLLDATQTIVTLRCIQRPQ